MATSVYVRVGGAKGGTVATVEVGGRAGCVVTLFTAGLDGGAVWVFLGVINRRAVWVVALLVAGFGEESHFRYLSAADSTSTATKHSRPCALLGSVTKDGRGGATGCGHVVPTSRLRGHL